MTRIRELRQIGNPIPEKDRMRMIGAIRTMLPELWDQGRFEFAKEVMEGIHQDDFTGISGEQVQRIYRRIQSSLQEN